MSGHTKGPWRVEQDTTLVWGACNADDTTSYGMGYPIAECRITPSSSWAKGPDADQGEANARLIASAPDLLETAKGLESEVSAIGMFAFDVKRLLGEEHWNRLLKALGDARNAIAKAEGRSDA